MSDNIADLSIKFKKTADLKAFADRQSEALVAATKKITDLEQEVAHLKQLLGGLPLVNDARVEKIIKTPEMFIVESQLAILEQRALQKELSLDELKAFDLLVKAKKILAEPSIPADKKPKSIPDLAQLVQIASQVKKSE